MRTVTDVSYYQIFNSTHYDLLATGTDGMIVRTGFGDNLDSLAKKHIAEMRLRNKPASSYWWVDPTKDKTKQINLIIATTKKYMLPSVFLDAEQYWTDWAAYMRGDYATAYATRYAPDYLNSYYKDVYVSVKQGLPGVEVGNYSGDWFIDKYAPGLRKWIFASNYWEARYLRWYDKKAYDELNKSLGIPFDINHVEDFKFISPIIRGVARQFESLMYVRGMNYNQDWNFITDEAYSRIFDMDIIPGEDPEVPPPVVSKAYVVTALALNIRMGPSTTYPKVGYYYKGNQVSIYEVYGDWGKTEKGWICLLYTSKIQGTYKVITPFLNIREIPTIDSKVVGWLKLGDLVGETARTGTWINIGRGWASSKYLKPV
jgi:hypothetical protein